MESDVSLTPEEFDVYLDEDGSLSESACSDLCFDHSSDPATTWDECTDQGMSGDQRQVRCRGTEESCSVAGRAA